VAGFVARDELEQRALETPTGPLAEHERRFPVTLGPAQHPEIDDQQITAPLFGLGLPRTGSTALSFLDLYRDPILAQNTAVSDFALEDLVSHERPVSLYLTVPPSDLSRTRPLVRLLLNQACRRLTERMDFSAGRGRGAGKHPLLLKLDEFAALGKLQFFQESLAYLAGHDIRGMRTPQDLPPHRGVHGETGDAVMTAIGAVDETAVGMHTQFGRGTVAGETGRERGLRINGRQRPGDLVVAI